MKHTSQSEIKLSRKCRKAHWYRYGERLARRRPNRPALVGTILHEMLDAKVKGGAGAPWAVLEKYRVQYAKLFREEQEEFGDIPQLAKAIYKGYWRRWKDSGLVFLESEVEFRIELAPKIELVGFIDKIAEDRLRFVTDHKFHKNLPGPDDRFSDIQTVLYFWVWNELHTGRGNRVDGILWDYGRMKAPAVPEVLKRGGLSKRANIDTDVHTYREALRKNGIPEKGYRDILKKLEGKDRTFFERVPLPAPSKHLIKEVVADARESAIQAKKDLDKGGKVPRSMSGFNCKGCEFRPLCEAEVRGLDSKFIRKKEYVNRDEVKEKKYGEIDEAA